MQSFDGIIKWAAEVAEDRSQLANVEETLARLVANQGVLAKALKKSDDAAKRVRQQMGGSGLY